MFTDIDWKSNMYIQLILEKIYLLMYIDIPNPTMYFTVKYLNIGIDTILKTIVLKIFFFFHKTAKVGK